VGAGNTAFKKALFFSFITFLNVEMLSHSPLNVPGALFHFYFSACFYLDKFFILTFVNTGLDPWKHFIN